MYDSNFHLFFEGRDYVCISMIRQQISPIFRLNNLTLAAMDIYEVCFIDTLKPFGVSIYEVVESSVDSRPSFATISANAGVTVKFIVSAPNILTDEACSKEFKAEQIRGDTLTLKNSEVEATFSSLNGFLKSVTPNGHKEIDVEVKFVHYGVRSPGMIKNSGGDNLSGAYLFLPDGQAKEFRQRNSNFVVVDGPLMKRVYVVGPSELKILQVYSLPEGSPSVLITNEVDIRSTSNFELAMRLNTNIESGDDVFTDLNALQLCIGKSHVLSGGQMDERTDFFQLIRRRRLLDKLPLQAHFYPMPSSAYIEDRSTRLSLLGAQALGVASLRSGCKGVKEDGKEILKSYCSGQIEVMLDRRLNQDDGRGLSQGVLDNHRTMSHFRLLVEPLSHVDDDNAGRDLEERVGYHSLVGFAQSMEIHYPTVRMISRGKPESCFAYFRQVHY
ncbi:unnamed protein product [Nippostrongylus brasiliensis]|uniref:Alpha-mannosidase 2 (inferred by orthology to a D. melanogaster protein) n=1 Tax=Nippostrongylus brasiliensis TaxID=27835 RepID=A0A158R0Q4_NIPBR|nr:unnamed protein product [Nippostrongylus brasiliensis]